MSQGDPLFAEGLDLTVLLIVLAKVLVVFGFLLVRDRKSVV
jgi:hypothetical protein